MKLKSKYNPRIFSILVTLASILSYEGFAQQAPTQIDGQNDFDFHFGKWRSHIQTLANPLTGSKTWIKLEGTVMVSKIWDGKEVWKKSKPRGRAVFFKAQRRIFTIHNQINGAKISR